MTAALPMVEDSVEKKNSEHGVILTENCMTVACQAMKCLPQYHPDHLMALLNLGMLI